MQTLKKTIGWMFGLALFAGMILLFPMMTKAEISGDYEYTVLEDGTAEITWYDTDGSFGEEELIVPDKINGYKVTSISDFAFSDFDEPITVIIPASIRNIDRSAFRSNELKGIKIASGNEVYDSRNDCNAIIETRTNTLIRGCSNSVIPESVTSIGSLAFSDCGGIKELTIPQNITRIGSYAFAGCNDLEKVTLPNSITNIEAGVFSDCKELTEITIPKGVVSIGSSAFEGCIGLTSFTIPEEVTSIGRAAFMYCSNLTSIMIPKSVTSLEKYAFSDCEGLTSITIPESITSIEESVFSGCHNLKNITIPESVTIIKRYAFAWCNSLTDIMIPKSVTSIEGGPFSFCPAIERIQVSSDNEVFDSRDNCNAIIEKETNTLILGCKNTEFPDSITSIGNAAFSGCSGLKNITIPDTVTSIGENAFEDCSELTSITIPENVTSIGSYAFSGCGFTSITIPESITYIENGTFSYSGLTSIVLHEGITGIGGNAFGGCENLESITIPKSVTSIGGWAFMWCGLTDVFYNGSRIDRNKITIDDWNNEALFEANWIYAEDSNLTRHEAVSATCTTDGNSEYWVDEETGAIYADEAGTKPLSRIPVIKALGHSWDAGSVTKAATTSSDGTKTFTCTRCWETKTEVIPKLKEEAKPSGNVSTTKKANPLKVKVTKKTLKRSSLKKAKKISIGAKGQGKVTYTLDKKAKKAKIKVSKKGVVTIPKNCKKGTYKITVKAAGNSMYKAGKKVITIKIK